MSITSLAVGFSLLIGFVVGLILAIFVAVQLRRVPDLAFLKHYHPVGTVEIFDNRDKFVCSIELDNKRTVLPFDQIPLVVQQAVMAAEDRHFYEHPGVNFKSMVRAAIVDIQARHVVEGGSTITQQLVKNLFFYDSERSIDRKVAEAMVALDLERHFSKPEILAMYLNEVYFGNGANGIEQASLRYFGKDVSKLGLAEAAYLIGLIRSPTILGSQDHKDEAIKAQRQILDAISDCQYATHYQTQHAKLFPLVFKSALPPRPQHLFNTYPYYVSYVLDDVKTRYGETYIKREGLKVYTNLDQVAQQTGERVIAQGIKHAPPGITNGALVSLSVRDGAVRAIVGGAGDYWSKQWNCAVNPHTVGSAFKPFVYLTAFLGGALGPNSEIEDTALTVHQIDSADYSPKNYDGKFMGTIPVRQALALSRNVCAVRVAQMVGMNNVVQTAQEAGITGDIAPNISSALGSSALSPLDLAGAYGTLARCGIRITPRAIRRVENMKGQVLDAFASEPYRVFPEEKVAWLDLILQEVVKSGTGTQARLADRPVAGKTGTADKAKDLWFVGFTPDMVTAIWAGNENNVAITDKHVTGGTVLARLWREYNKQYYARNPLPAGEFIATKYDDSSSARAKPIEPPTPALAQPDQQLTSSPAGADTVKPFPRTAPRPTATPSIIPSTSQYPTAHTTYSGARPTVTVHKNGMAQGRGKGITDYSWSR